jgi:hypothetical protein
LSKVVVTEFLSLDSTSTILEEPRVGDSNLTKGEGAEEVQRRRVALVRSAACGEWTWGFRLLQPGATERGLWR